MNTTDQIWLTLGIVFIIALAISIFFVQKSNKRTNELQISNLISKTETERHDFINFMRNHVQYYYRQGKYAQMEVLYEKLSNADHTNFLDLLKEWRELFGTRLNLMVKTNKDFVKHLDDLLLKSYPFVKNMNVLFVHREYHARFIMEILKIFNYEMPGEYRRFMKK
ncbi:MAG: hypothetical protein ACR2IQ_01010 [Minisyncoccia bacterium]